jgi:hypothetical protein
MGAYDPETLTILRKALDDAWSLLSDERKARIRKSDMADRILRRAENGERDPVKLRAAALMSPSRLETDHVRKT